MAAVSGGNALIDPQVIIDHAGITERMVIGDLGCGRTGHFVFPLAAAVGKDGMLYAVDILKHNLANIDRRARQENIKQIKTVWSNLELFNATAIESASLDAALLINVLFQSNKRVEMIREAVRMVKIGGKLVIIDWNSQPSPLGPAMESRVSQENLKSAATRLGVQLQDEFSAGTYHFGLVFTRTA